MRLWSKSGLCALAFLVGSSSILEALTPVGQELNTLLTIVKNIRDYYIEEISPDTLMHAGVKGLFYTLDPSSEYTFSQQQNTGWRDSFETFRQIAYAVNDSSLYSTTPDTLVRFGIAGMLSILDPYTNFMENQNLDNFIIHTRGSYGGLGFRIQVIQPDSAIAVWSLLHQDTPAARAGVRSGDLILAIDDSTTKYLSAGDAADRMRGEPGTPVTLTLQRAGAPEPFKVSIIREVVQVRSVPYCTLFADSTGYVKLEGFQQKCSQEVREVLADLQQRGMKRLIFDLRGNGGGYLQEAVSVAELFLAPQKLVVYTAGRAIADTARYFTAAKPLVPDEPMIILVDGESASASEIVSGAIQDWDRGLIMGMPTVGKGSVQQTISISEKAELKLTIAAYFTPSGRSIDKRMRKDSTLVGSPNKEFKTLARGRIVHGGGGIVPDIYMEPMERRLWATPLNRQLAGGATLNNRFFHFARQYPVTHPGLTPDFRADEETVQEFRQFAAKRGFEYVSEYQSWMQDLEKKAAEEKQADKIAQSLQTLREEIEDIEADHWKNDQEMLAWKLTYDILEKDFGLKAAEAYRVSVDPQVLRARQVLADPKAYEEYFKKVEILLPPDPKLATAAPDSDSMSGE
ncbi:MAG: S41 family peptidase [Candidatus Latescibacteria bacterium]|nr:S41 family peptidase [Candidatus Latescibacterota bacterium]